MITGISIGQLGRATGTAVETVRYYEKIGLLAPASRTAGNYRSYGRPEVDRLSFIRRARNLGFSLDQVRTLLGLADDCDRPCGEVDQLTRTQLEQVERKIRDLEALRLELSGLIRQCQQGTNAECRILEALDPREHQQSKWRAEPRG